MSSAPSRRRPPRHPAPGSLARWAGRLRDRASGCPPYAGTLEAGQEYSYRLPDDRHAWVQVIRGGVLLNGTALTAGDGTAVSKETMLHLRASEAAELLLFDWP